MVGSISWTELLSRCFLVWSATPSAKNPFFMGIIPLIINCCDSRRGAITVISVLFFGLNYPPEGVVSKVKRIHVVVKKIFLHCCLALCDFDDASMLRDDVYILFFPIIDLVRRFYYGERFYRSTATKYCHRGGGVVNIGEKRKTEEYYAASLVKNTQSRESVWESKGGCCVAVEVRRVWRQVLDRCCAANE
mmetsp:Transcript_1229/g.2567  ORF Transcript_1229/g.2567 Transcript_1229/m.2567 type:complete len:191 (-) Transcript_1229:37-609(-)